MSYSNPRLHPATTAQSFDRHFLFDTTTHNSFKPLTFDSKVMWRNFANQAILRTPRMSSKPYCLSRPCNFLGAFQGSLVLEKWIFKPFELSSSKKLNFSEVGFCRNRGSLSKEEIWERPNSMKKGYASLAEVEVASEDDISFDNIQELVEEMREKEERAQRCKLRQQKLKPVVGLLPNSNRYKTLRNRQLKLETESWKQAVNEYKKLLSEMCEQKLAPNLPYVKSLFLGWFEPLKDSILEDQELIRQGKCRASYAPYFDQLPAEMMSIITMHKLMGLLMTGSDHGIAKVVAAACAIGEAIEQEVIIHKFLEKTKKKKGNRDKKGEEGSVENKNLEQQELGKKLGILMQKQKRRQVLKIVTSQDDSKPWGADARAKVGSRLIELLVKTAYVQPPANQSAEDPPDLRPAFVRTLMTFGPENKKASRRCGVIVCDPLIVKGLERTPRHMVIPYMPMLVPPEKWTEYGFVALVHCFPCCSEALTPHKCILSKFMGFSLLGRNCTETYG